jgi:hypothetical protein
MHAPSTLALGTREESCEREKFVTVCGRTSSTDKVLEDWH